MYKRIPRCARTIAISIIDNQLPSELQHAFEEAIAKYDRWQGGDEPTVSYQMQDRSISSICNLMTFYENVPLRPAIMAPLTAVAHERGKQLRKRRPIPAAPDRISKGMAAEARAGMKVGRLLSERRLVS